MTVNILAFGIAKDILRAQKMSVVLDNGPTVGSLRSHLLGHYPEFQKLASLSFAVNEEYVQDSMQLKDGDEVIIIPPVSGG